MIVYLAMIFAVFEILSTIFNQYFFDVFIFGIFFPLNISVVFFCLAFFVLDITTEIYNNHVADKLIYGKLICQIIFVIFGEIGIIGANLKESQLSNIISTTPIMILNGMIASLIGYKLTTRIMQKMKMVYHGKLLPLRYICSTLPGEIVFSLVFVSLSFCQNQSLNQLIMIFYSLTIIKVILSLVFSLIIVPIISIIRLLSNLQKNRLDYMPFT